MHLLNLKCPIKVKLEMVGATGFEPMTSCSQSTRATNCATPRQEKIGYPNRILKLGPKARAAPNSISFLAGAGEILRLLPALRLGNLHRPEECSQAPDRMSPRLSRFLSAGGEGRERWLPVETASDERLQ